MCELIVPISSNEQIKTLADAKATAMVFSCDFFATRQMAYFNKNEFIKNVNTCKELNLNSYTVINRMFVESELGELKEYMIFLRDLAISGIYYSDPAVYVIAVELDMVSMLIFNQDTILTNSCDISAYLNFGIKRCVISREITLEEISEIIKNNHNCELMIHGHMNLSYSKRMLAKAYFEEIAVQSDSKVFTIIEEGREQKMYLYEDEQGTHIFTYECLQMVNELPKIMNDLKAVRIDGIFMNFEEILEATTNYTSIINGGNSSEVYDSWISNNDNYTSGYLYKKTNLVKQVTV